MLYTCKKNPILHPRTKHIEIKHHFLKDHAHKEVMVLEFLNTKNQLADIFTILLALDSFLHIRRGIGIIDEFEVYN